jgi:hypothetical protein
MGLEILKGRVRTPELYDLSCLVVPDVVEIEVSREPVKLLPTVTDEPVHVSITVHRHVVLTVMCVGRVVRSHYFLSLLRVSCLSYIMQLGQYDSFFFAGNEYTASRMTTARGKRTFFIYIKKYNYYILPCFQSHDHLHYPRGDV